MLIGWRAHHSDMRDFHDHIQKHMRDEQINTKDRVSSNYICVNSDVAQIWAISREIKEDIIKCNVWKTTSHVSITSCLTWPQSPSPWPRWVSAPAAEAPPHRAVSGISSQSSRGQRSKEEASLYQEYEGYVKLIWTTAETYLKYWRVGSGHNTDCLCLCLPMLQIPRLWHQTYRGHWPHLGRGDSDRSDTWEVMGWPSEYFGYHVPFKNPIRG